jgi:hypothetical protein
MGRAGVLKVYRMFNDAQFGEIRKLAGKLLTESLH